jgi:hypothetical protein
MIPRVVSWMPPRNRMDVMVDAQPRMAAPEMSFWYRTLSRTRNATPETRKPMMVASRSGSSEKAKNASVAIRSSLRGDCLG